MIGSQLGLSRVLHSQDIFFNNCFKNGMLPVVLPRNDVLVLLDDAEAGHEIGEY